MAVTRGPGLMLTLAIMRRVTARASGTQAAPPTMSRTTTGESHILSSLIYDLE